jgi:hypothetical protein
MLRAARSANAELRVRAEMLICACIAPGVPQIGHHQRTDSPFDRPQPGEAQALATEALEEAWLEGGAGREQREGGFRRPF